MHGSLEEHAPLLQNLQKQSAGVFTTINKTDRGGRKSANIQKIRALFIDLDGAPLEPIFNAPITPHLIIESSPGRYHCYWKVEDVSLEHFGIIQKLLAQRFGGDLQVHDLSRFMRLPGFYHQKKGTFLTQIIQESGEKAIGVEPFLNAFHFDLSFQQQKSQSIKEKNTFLDVLQVVGLLIEKQSHPQGCWAIKCPWRHLHSSEDKGTKYYEPNGAYSSHGFKCFHQHCSRKTIHDLKEFLGIEEPLLVFDEEPIHLKQELSPVEWLAPELLPKGIGELCVKVDLAFRYYNKTGSGREGQQVTLEHV